MRCFLIERGLGDRRGDPFSSNLDLEDRTLLGKLGRDICRSDRDAKCRAQRAAADDTARLIAGEDGVSVSRNVALRQREPDELLLHAVRFLIVEHWLADEIPLLELDQPP